MRNQSFQVIETEWIPLSDGTRLAARIWMPDAAAETPCPAILEYLPYQRRDGTSQRDECTYPAFAEAGYVGVRVDLRGSGDSEGRFDDEYSPQELADACEVIAWIAGQPWCSGKVGMMGISWGGFNALQVAALQPPALKAVIALSTTVDRYHDDIHYKGGCQLSAQHYWSSTMLSHLSRCPDPAVVGEAWRQRWLERLEGLEPPLHLWLAHQRRDGQWRHGSICEDYGALKAAALVIGGWADGYRNAPPAAAANLTAPAKALIGPWVHKYPHFARPQPRLDFVAEALRWWDRWLKGERNGAGELPSYRAYISEGVRPGLWREREPGRWVAVGDWTGEQPGKTLYLGSRGLLAETPGLDGQRLVASPQDCGLAAGEYFTSKPDAELSADQRADDGKSRCFDTLPLETPLEILGRPKATLRLSIDKPVGMVVVRLCDLHPDGTSHRVSWGVLNLTHRCSDAEPRPVVPGETMQVEVPLDETGYRFPAGHRIRLAVSTAYFPMLLPPPEAVTARLVTGAASQLRLPLLEAAETIELPEPAEAEPLPAFPQHAPGESRRWVERDLSAGVTRYHILEDEGESEHPGNGMRFAESRRETWSVAWDDPKRLEGVTHLSSRRRRGDWEVRTETHGRLTTDGDDWILEHRLEAYVGQERVFAREWRKTIPRDLM